MMDLDQEMHELQRAADHWTACHFLRMAGYGAILFGSIIVGVELVGKAQNLSVLAGLLGFALVLLGVWLVTTPSAAGLLVLGGFVLIVAIVNLVITARAGMEILAGRPATFRDAGLALFGLFQMGLAWQSLSAYRRYRHVLASVPTPERRRWIKDLLKQTIAGHTEENDDLVEFHSMRRMKGKLLPRMAIFLEIPGQHVHIVGKDEVEVVKLHEASFLFTKGMACNLKIRERVLLGFMSFRSLANYQQWKG